MKTKAAVQDTNDEIVIEPEEALVEELDGDEVPGEEDSTDDEVIVTIGDEAPPQEEEEQEPAPEWVRELRKSHREMQRENRALKDQVKTLTSPETKPEVKLGKKPELADFEYDTEKYDAAFSVWYEKKRQLDDQAAQAAKDKETEQQAWQAKLQAYGTEKSTLKVKDFDEAEAVVMDLFNQVQQGIMMQGADSPAVLIYALGKNKSRAQELAKLTDPVKFAFAVAKLEKDLKVKSRKAPPPPEKTVTGTGSKGGAVDSTLERLRTEAEKTGDYSKVIKHKQRAKT